MINKNTLLLFFLLLTQLPFAQNTQQEFRAVWVATAWGGIDFPKNKITHSSFPQIEAQQAEIIAMLDTLKKGNVNAIMFQVRAHGDAMYRSSYEPWSHALTGTRGNDPGYDPLAFVVDEAHKRGIEVHAWVNPYRISNYPLNAKQIKPSWIINRGSAASFLDPASEHVREYTMMVISEIIDNYDIDGLVFDDYFYKSMPKEKYAKHETHRTKRNNEYSLSLGDWRRENVNKLMKSVREYIDQRKPYLRFGISPFGIYSTKTQRVYDEEFLSYDTIPAAVGIAGTDSYSDMYCDAATWLKRGYIDYISPQLYWPAMAATPTYNRQQDYAVLCRWWNDLAKRYSRPLFTSNDLADNGKDRRFNAPDDVARQLEINSKADNVEGAIFYSASFFMNKNSANTHFQDDESYHTYLVETNHFARKALTPSMPWKGEETIAKPTNLRIEDNTLMWDCENDNARFAVYRFPKSVDVAGAICDNEYLVDVCYGKSYKIDNKVYAKDNWAVRTFSRYSNLGDVVTLLEKKPVKAAVVVPPFVRTKKGIRIEPKESTYVQIYSESDGRLVYQDYIDKRTNVKLKKKKYIVKLNGESYTVDLMKSKSRKDSRKLKVKS